MAWVERRVKDLSRRRASGTVTSMLSLLSMIDPVMVISGG